MKEKVTCPNILCIHNKANAYGEISTWNETCCDFYEIDPYDKKKNKIKKDYIIAKNSEMNKIKNILAK